MKSSHSRAELQLIVLDCQERFVQGVVGNPDHSLWRTKELSRTKELNLWWSMTHVASVHLTYLRAKLCWREPGWFAPPVAQLVLAGRARGALLIYCCAFLWGWLTKCRQSVRVCKWRALLTVCASQKDPFAHSCRCFMVCRCVSSGVCWLNLTKYLRVFSNLRRAKQWPGKQELKSSAQSSVWHSVTHGFHI